MSLLSKMIVYNMELPGEFRTWISSAHSPTWSWVGKSSFRKTAYLYGLVKLLFSNNTNLVK